MSLQTEAVAHGPGAASLGAATALSAPEPHSWRSRARGGLATVASAALPILAARVLPAAISEVTLWALAVLVAVIAVGLVRPKVLVLALLLVIGGRAGAELGALHPIPTTPVDFVEVVLTDDPRSNSYGWTAVSELEGARVQLTVPISTASASAGDRLTVSGTQRGAPPDSDWQISQRIVGRVSASEVHSVTQAGGPIGVANVARDSIRSGASSLSSSRRILFTGLVFGDDRGQDVIVADNFRASGLGHLLAVSGQNVVFVLLLAAPLLSRIRSVPVRVGLTLLVLMSFGFLTRFEASVTRALVMAGLAALAHALGRPNQAALVLPPAVAGLLLVDPLLAWSLAFQLSVAATLGLIVLSPLLVEALRGPEVFRLAVGATLAAQLFVAPLLFTSFGSVSVVAVPANLLAAPAAAGTMMWGLVAGPIAGVSPEWLAAGIHLPTRAMLWWLDGVAALFARVAPGQFTPWHLAAVVGAVGALGVVRAFPVGRYARPVIFATLVAVAGPTFVVPKPLPPGRHVMADDVVVARSTSGHDIVILGPSARVDEVVESLRQARLGRIDLVIAESGSRHAGRTVSVLVRRFEVTDIWAPDGHQIPGARVVEPFAGSVGSLVITESAAGEVEIRDGERNGGLAGLSFDRGE